jgi:putative RNA 2'-phosphotransferase
MLKECNHHGYFRGEKCPSCNNIGKFLMSAKELDIISRIMAGILRHFPAKFNLKMDLKGWVDLQKFIDAIRKNNRFKWLRPYHIKGIIETDPKGRYQIKDNKLRATYGHTLSLELDLPTDNIPAKLYYPTTEEEVDIILETGIKPVERKKVHLSKTIEDAITAGLCRVEHPVILEIDAEKARSEGIVIKQAGKTVYLVDDMPAKYLTKVKV